MTESHDSRGGNAPETEPHVSLQIETHTGSAGTQNERGWVIESGHNPPSYWTGKSLHSGAFSPKHDDAIRFARHMDAEVVRCWLLEQYSFALRSVEHMWCEP